MLAVINPLRELAMIPLVLDIVLYFVCTENPTTSSSQVSHDLCLHTTLNNVMRFVSLYLRVREIQFAKRSL